MPSQSTESKWMPKIETPNLCNSTVKEKASIKTSNLQFHEGLYKLHGKSKNQQEEEECPQKLSNYRTQL